MKQIVKKFVPNSWVLRYREYREHRKVIREFRQDARQFNRSTNFHLVGSSPRGVKELLIFHTHALEKGLSHPNFRPNFGKRALTGLHANMVEFERLGLDKRDFAYQNAQSVLAFYKKKHSDAEIATPFFDELFPAGGSGLEVAVKAGAFSHENKDARTMNFAELEKFRTTQRQFSEEPLDLSVFKDVVALAMKTPSVCNRQPWQLYVTDNADKIKRLLKIQKGFNGYPLPPALSLVTVDRRAFIGSFERNEAYIDGGLFLMNYDFALTYFGLASCILNVMLPNEELDEIRKILNIPAQEVLVAFVAVGKPMPNVLTAASARKPFSDILNFAK